MLRQALDNVIATASSALTSWWWETDDHSLKIKLFRAITLGFEAKSGAGEKMWVDKQMLLGSLFLYMYMY